MNKKIITSVIIVIAIIIAIFLFAYSQQHATSSYVSNIQTAATTSATSNVSSSQSRVPGADVFSINTPNALILVDSQGRRIGEDPSTGVYYQEIPGGSYDNEGKSGNVDFENPPTGDYTLYVIGGQNGSYILDSTLFDDKEDPGVRQTITGTIEAGEALIYAQNYNASDPASSTLVYQGTVSSTANITTAPPDNLPLPTAP